MKKYITTKENKIFRDGISVTFTKGTFVHEPYYDKEEDVIRVHLAELDFYIHNKKWIKEIEKKEVEKKEFTRSELKNIAHGIFGGTKDTVYKRIDQYLEYHIGK